jgi:PPOX class probable F420-dependent enzyme
VLGSYLNNTRPNEETSPVSMLERLGWFSDRLFDRVRSKRAFALAYDNAIDGDSDCLRGYKYAVLVTFRRNGEAVPSPVWCSVDERGKAYIKTRHDAGKVKRLRNDSRAVIAASDIRGRPLGSAIKTAGRVLPRDEWAHAEQTLAAAYGAGRRISERPMGGPEDLAAYVELTPSR